MKNWVETFWGKKSYILFYFLSKVYFIFHGDSEITQLENRFAYCPITAFNEPKLYTFFWFYLSTFWKKIFCFVNPCWTYITKRNICFWFSSVKRWSIFLIILARNHIWKILRDENMRWKYSIDMKLKWVPLIVWHLTNSPRRTFKECSEFDPH